MITRAYRPLEPTLSYSIWVKNDLYYHYFNVQFFNLQLPLASRSFIASISSLFSCWTHNFIVLVHCQHSRSDDIGHSRRLLSVKKLYKPNAHYLLSTKWLTDTVSDQMMNIVEHLAARCFPQELVKVRTKLKFCKYWTCIHQLGTKTAECVKQLFVCRFSITTFNKVVFKNCFCFPQWPKMCYCRFNNKQMLLFFFSSKWLFDSKFENHSWDVAHFYTCIYLTQVGVECNVYLLQCCTYV